jgi:SH3-like domain-containing protein
MLRLVAIAILTFSIIPRPAGAQDVDLPYWASITAEEARMRVGPGEQFQIEWLYNRPGLPVKVVRYHQGWRLIEEQDGTRGWMFSSLLSRQRTAVVIGEGPTPMRATASPDGRLRWSLEPGVVGKLGECEAGWCALDIEGHRGFVEESRLWGVGDP